MSKSKVKTERVSGFRIAVMIISVLLLSFIMAFSMLLGISTFKHNGPIVLDENATTVRKRLPSNGTLPTQSSAIDNIGYMAYVLDHQPSYHVYAYNSTKSTGYEQVTQSWKDYKNADLSGAGVSVMVCSDLSHSALIKSSSQSCFIGSNEAHVRSGSKPNSKNTKPSDIDWSSGVPSIYDKKGYKYSYGEFSTEISVYVINEQTLSDADAVVDNGDGTYTQKYYLNEAAGVWYQYGMKTRGGLKSYPKFRRIEITFTFDSKWQIIESYCEEKATINPRALGGMDMPSTSKTTTTYDYTEAGFDNEHFAYFENYFKPYVGTGGGSVQPPKQPATITDVLAGGFSKVVGDDGQQFRVALTLGNTQYDGKVYLHLGDMSDILNNLEVRLSLEKKGSGKQDLYAEFKNGAVNVYYSTDFALTADINKVSTSVGQIVDWVKGITSSPAQAKAVRHLLTNEPVETADSGIDLGSLLEDLKLDDSLDTEATISLKSDNLLGLGIGIDVVLVFDKTPEDDSFNYSIRNIDLNYLEYNHTRVDLNAEIEPDDGKVISRQTENTPANLADYADSVYNLLNKNTIKVDIGLADKLIDGLTLNAVSYVSIGSNIAANVEISAEYKGISLKLDASYIYEKASYGKIYLHVSEINGKAVNAKVYCEIGDTVNTVKNIISLFKGNGEASVYNESAPEAENQLAVIINKVLNLNFSKIIGKVSGDNSSLQLDVNVDELLKGLDVSLGFDFGTLALKVNREPIEISGNVSSLGLDINISGSDKELPVIKDTGNYVDVNMYLESVYSLLRKPSYDISVSFEGTKISDSIDLSDLTVSSVATVAVENGTIRVKLPVSVKYGEYGIELTAYYTINLSDGSYGKVYLNIASVSVADEEIALDAKVYCDIKNVVDGVKDIIAKFSNNNGISVASEDAGLLANAIETLLKLNYNEIITATNEDLTVKLDVDEILSGLKVSLGGISFGELNLDFAVTTGELSGKLETLGLTVGISGNDVSLEEFATGGYVDLGKYLDSVSTLMAKKSYSLELSFVGNDYVSTDIDLTGLSLDVSAQAAFVNNFKGIDVNISELKVAYYEVSLELSAHYDVNFDGSYGTVYLNITKVNGVEVSAKVQLDVTEAVNSVKNIINAFKAPSVQTYGVNTDIVANVINGVLKLDFKELLNVTDEKAAVKLDLDALLSEFNLGLNLGEVNLEYVPADFELTGSDTAIGLNLIKFTGTDNELAAFSTDGYIDLNAFISGVEGIVNSKIYEIGLNFTGKEITEKIDLNGLNVNAKAYVALENGYNNITISVPMQISYCGLAVELTAYYSADINAKDYSTVYIALTRIDNTQLDAKVYCNISDAISTVKQIINSFKQPEANPEVNAETADIISKVVGIVLNLDYPEIIKGSKENLSVTLNVDDILSALDINIGGIEFGNLQLDLTLDGKNKAVLSGKLDNLGVAMTLAGNDSYQMPAAPEKSDYLDLNSALKLAEDIINEGKKIAAEKDVAFIVSGIAAIDGVDVQISGSGEVIWGDTLQVAVALSVTVDGEHLDINIVYDKNSEPFVILTVNEAGVKVRHSDIDKLVNSFKGLIDAFKKNETTENGNEPQEVSAYAMNVGGYDLEEILKNTNVKKVLNALLGFVSDFAVEIETVDSAEDINTLLIKHTGGAVVTLGADGCLSLSFAKTDKFNICATVEAGSGATVSSILNELTANEKTKENADGKYTYYEISKFVKILCNGIFDKLDKLSLKNILGDNPYLVTLNLSGVNSGISVLEGVRVKAELYYDEGVAGTQRATKLMHAGLELDINGTIVLASVAYSGRTLFVELNKIGATTLDGIKFKTDVENIFDAAEQLVKLITDTNVVETLNRLTGKGSITSSDVANITEFATLSDENGTTATSALTKLIDALLNLNLEQSFKFDKQTNTAVINVDSISEALLNVKIGTVTAAFNSNEKTLTASVKIEDGDAWFTLNAAPAERRTDIINPDNYTDIGFISTLISDLVKTVTNGDKELYNLYTLIGTINVKVNDIPALGSLDINFKNATLTAGFDADNKFYLTLAASMQKTSAIGFTVTANRDISITYSDGLIVLGREIGTTNEKYKVLTLEYLLDNLLDKNNSPIRWWLGTSDTVWGILVNNLKLNLDSGLTKPKTYTLFEQLKQNVKENKFDLSDYLLGMTVKAGDSEPLSVYDEGAELATAKFNLADDNNHYAFDINAKKLTGGTVTALCAAILRDGNGLSGVKAYGEVGSMVNFTLDFAYREGITELYGGKTLNLEKVTVNNENDFYNDYEEAANVTATNFTEKTYYKYNGDSGEYDQATEFEDGVAYFVKVNTVHYIYVDGKPVLATEFVAGTDYYRYVEGESTKKLGEVAVPNYLDYVSGEKYGFDRNHPFTNNTPHINSIFGCFNTEDNSYVASNVLETIYLDVYASTDGTEPERTLEVLYGSTVKLISDFPEFADEDKTTKLIYRDVNGEVLSNSIVISDGNVEITYVDEKGRVSIYKSSVEGAIEVVFHFVGIDGMDSASAAFVAGDVLAEYVLNDYSFLGWYKDESLTTPVLNSKVNKTDIVNGKIDVYGKYIKTLYEAENGVNYSFDTVLDAYYVSGVNENIEKYYNNADLWLEIASKINGYDVKYIAQKAFANAENDIAHSLVNVLVPVTVEAVYDRAFLDNKGLKQVAFCADKVFFGGRADSNGKTSVYYGCYPGNAANNNAFTVYYNGTQTYNPYTHIETTNAKIDSAWNRIYFNKPTVGSSTAYTMSTKSGDWAFVKFETEIVNLDGSTQLPEGADLSGIIYDGIHLVGYAEAGNLANTISDKLIEKLGKNIYSVTASSGIPLRGKIYSVKITLTEHEEIIAQTTDIDVTIKFGDFEYTTTVKNVEADANLAAIYTALNFDGKGDYAFIGWYKDAKFEVAAPATNDGSVSELYAKVVKQTVTAANGVIYSFVAENAHYVVSGFDVNSADKDYTSINYWLVLENEISNIPVTEIKSEAFSSKKTGVYLKNVVVPSNIEKVGARAFLDNYDIRNVAFTADNVYFEGTGDQTVFYGCSTVDGGNMTNLSVYYNSMSAAAGDDWGYFRTNSHIGRNGKGSAVSSGWYFVSFKFTGNVPAGFAALTDGVKNEAQSAELLNRVVTEYLNELSVSYGYINAYTVTIEEGYSTVGKINEVTVDFANNKPFYMITFDDGIVGSKAVGDAVEYYNGNAYAQADSSVTLTSPDGYEFTSVTVGGTQLTAQDDGSYTFVMGNGTVTVSGTTKKVGIKQTTIISAVKYKYDGKEYESDETVLVTDVKENETTLKEISATGYIFIGWAYDDGSKLVLTKSSVIVASTYYAVWAVERDEIKTYGFNENGTSLDDVTVTIDTDYANSFYGWYAYNDITNFENKISNVSETTTVLYARVYYKLSYTLKGSSNSNSYYYFNGDNVNDKSSIKGSQYTKSISVLEGTIISVSLDDNTTQLKISYNSDSEEVARAKKVGTWGPSDSKKFTLPDISSFNNKKANKNISFTVTF